MSAIVKLAGQHSLAANWRALTFGNSVGVVLLLVPVVLSLLALVKHVVDDEPQGRYVALLSLSTLLYLGYVLFLGRDGFRWYLAYPVFGSLVALVVCVLCEYPLMRETAMRRLDEERVAVPGRVELILGPDQLLGRYAIAPQFSERLYRLKPD